MGKGVIYIVFNQIISVLYYLNLVELFKFIGIKIYPKNRITASRASVDLFILLKFTLVILLWVMKVSNPIVNLLIWYLIASNIYTYFFYHVWSDGLGKPLFDQDRIRRRFLNLFLAIGFNIMSFAYLFSIPFVDNFEWKPLATVNHSLLYSFSNTTASSYEYVRPITEIGRTMTLIETSITFIFLVVILGNSIPQIKND